MGLDGAVVAEVDVDQGRRVDVGQDGVDAADMDEQRGPELSENADVDVAGRADRAHQRGVLALEDGGIAGDEAFDRLLEDHVGLVQATLRSSGGVVVDLDRQGRTLRAPTPRGPECRSAGRWQRPPAAVVLVVVVLRRVVAELWWEAGVEEQAAQDETGQSGQRPGCAPAAV